MVDDTWELPPATPSEHAAAVIAGLGDLGMLKPGEVPAILLHRHGCPAPTGGACACGDVGGPELIFSDWDELRPVRHFLIPERFYEHR
jgi:hypothetical protein